MNVQVCFQPLLNSLLKELTILVFKLPCFRAGHILRDEHPYVSRNYWPNWKLYLPNSLSIIKRRSHLVFKSLNIFCLEIIGLFTVEHLNSGNIDTLFLDRFIRTLIVQTMPRESIWRSFSPILATKDAQKHDNFIDTANVTEHSKGIICLSWDDKQITMSKDCHACTLVVVWEVVVVAQAEFSLFERIKSLLRLISKIQQSCLILHLIDLECCLHPVRLFFVEVRVVNVRLWDYEIFIVRILSKALLVVHNHEFWVGQVLLKVFNWLITCLARDKVDVQCYTVDLAHASDADHLVLVNTHHWITL